MGIMVLLAATWVAHVVLAFVPSSAVFALLTGQLPWPVGAALMGALVPQLLLVPWAWKDAGKRVSSPRQRALWRAAFFFTGFIAVTLYSCLYRRALR